MTRFALSRPPRRRAAPLLAACLCAAACGSAGRGGGAIVADSAGITIVTSASPAWGVRDAWTVAPEPLLSIGVRDGDPRYQLFAVYDAVRLGDGTIVVGDNGSHELRFYGADGSFAGSAGREGAGPGEFRFIWSIEAAADSLWVFDGALQRLSVFDRRGRFVRSAVVHTGQISRVAGRFADGTLLAIGGTAITGLRQQTGVVYDSSLYVLASPDGEVIDSIARLPDGERYTRTEGDRRTTIERAFAPTPRALVCGEHVIYGPADAYELRVYTRDGRLRALVRRATPNRPVTPADAERYVEFRLARTRERFRAMTRRMLEEMSFPETMPAYDRILADADGNLWVEEYRAPGETVPRWNVFEPGGAWLGTLALPERFHLLQVGRDFVLGRWRDDVDVEHVRVHRLEKRGGEAGRGAGAGGWCRGALHPS